MVDLHEVMQELGALVQSQGETVGISVPLSD